MKTPDELTKEQLINDLIKMQQRIDELEKIEEDKKRYVEELSRTKAMYEGLFEFAPDAIVVVNREGRIVQVNKQAERTFGYTREELLSADHDILLPERFREKHREHRRGFISEPRVRPMGTGLELYGRKKNGEEFPVDISLGPLQMKNDIVVLAVVRDVTERKQAEQKLLETKAELERSNTALEQFAYSVSHDLRAPLRHIDGFIRILSKDYSEKLEERGRDLIRRVQTGAERMTEIVDALLGLSRFARGPLSRSKVDLSTFAKTVAAELAKTRPERRVEFVIAEDVSAEGDAGMLRIVIENLMGNAWKFSEKRPVARIEFNVTLTDEKAVYCVKDDGAGFNMEYANKLFGPFQRLHAAHDFPGLGIGLATVQRIIHRHGGRIWAEAEVDKGATFCFTL
jgi:PAS domain S-box-containing protein